MSNFKAIILGCGGSGAVPNIANYWGVCDPNNPKNHRTRSSLAILTPGEKCIIIDTGPDFLHQINRENLPLPDSLLYTHYHADHIMGIDELRWVAMRRKEQVPIYGSKETLDVLKKRVHYLFESKREDLYPAVLKAHEIDYFKSCQTPLLDFLPIEMDHESCIATGYRIGDLAYCLDVKRLSDQSLEALKGIKTLIIDCSGNMGDTNPVHAGVPQILRWQETIQAERIILSSLTPHMDYEVLNSETPDFINAAYDGMKINFII